MERRHRFEPVLNVNLRSSFCKLQDLNEAQVPLIPEISCTYVKLANLPYVKLAMILLQEPGRNEGL